jgi:hypothetical protein
VLEGSKPRKDGEKKMRKIREALKVSRTYKKS